MEKLLFVPIAVVLVFEAGNFFRNVTYKNSEGKL